MHRLAEEIAPREEVEALCECGRRAGAAADGAGGGRPAACPGAGGSGRGGARPGGRTLGSRGAMSGRRAPPLGAVWGTCTPVTGAPRRGGAGGQVEAAAPSPRGGRGGVDPPSRPPGKLKTVLKFVLIVFGDRES